MRNFDWKKRLAIKNEIPPNILSHLQYNVNILVDKTFIQFSRFSEKYSFLFGSFLMTMVPFKNGMKLREIMINMGIFLFSVYNK